MKSLKWSLARLSPSMLVASLMLCLVAGATSCATGRQVVLIDSDGALLRAGPDVKGRVFFMNKAGDWELSKDPIQIPQGWFIGPMPKKP